MDPTGTDEASFSRAAERHRRELHVHCYRIATHACLDLLAKRRPAAASGGEVTWLQPYPDHLLDEPRADDADEPEAVAVARETIELAFVVAVQHLAPRPRAVFLLRDVLGWPAKDVAEALGDSVNSVNSALQRARAGMREGLPAERREWRGAEEDAGTRELVRRYVDACTATDLDELEALLRDDVRCSMPPTPGVQVGRDEVLGSWVADGFQELAGRMRTVLTSANRQPAMGCYAWDDEERAYLPLTVDVLGLEGGRIRDITTFHADQFPRLGLPERLDGPAPTDRTAGA